MHGGRHAVPFGQNLIAGLLDLSGDGRLMCKLKEFLFLYISEFGVKGHIPILKGTHSIAGRTRGA